MFVLYQQQYIIKNVTYSVMIMSDRNIMFYLLYDRSYITGVVSIDAIIRKIYVHSIIRTCFNNYFGLCWTDVMY